jgi:hypothetical protein
VEDLIEHALALVVVHLKHVIASEFFLELGVLNLEQDWTVSHVRVVSARPLHSQET